MIIPQALKSYFRETFPQFNPKSGILIACSGGPDSVGLVVALKNHFKGRNSRMLVGHVNHHLRGKMSNKDAEFVNRLAKKVRLPYVKQEAPVSRGESGNIEERARVKRYAALEAMARKNHCELIVTAHTNDDQVETILMNLARGAGPDGLSGMRPVRKLPSGVLLGRPFLAVSKAQVLQYVNEQQAPFRVDESNMDPNLTRNWIRQSLMPMWESRTGGVKEKILNTAKIFRDDQRYWEGILNKAIRHLAKPFKGGKLVESHEFFEHPISVQRRILRKIGGSDLLTFDGVERLRSWMASPPTNGRLFQLRKGWVVERLSRSQGSKSAHQYWFHNNTHKQKPEKSKKK